MARKPVDVGFETFLRENPEYSFSRMLEKSPRTEESVLPQGYDAWRSRRSGALGYRGEQSVSDQLGGAERFIREFYGAADAQPPQSDIEYEASGEAGRDRLLSRWEDDLSSMEPFDAEPTGPSFDEALDDYGDQYRDAFRARFQKWREAEARIPDFFDYPTMLFL